MWLLTHNVSTEAVYLPWGKLMQSEITTIPHGLAAVLPVQAASASFSSGYSKQHSTKAAICKFARSLWSTFTHVWRNELKRSPKKGGMKADGGENNMCSEEGQWGTSADCREYRFIAETSSLHCVTCHHILYSRLCYIISVQKAVILYNRFSLQAMSIQAVLTPDTNRMINMKGAW